MYIFGDLIPKWLSNTSLLILVVFGGYQIVYMGLRKFKSDTFGKFDSQIGSIADMYFLLFLAMLFIKPSFLFMFYYYALNVMMFLFCACLAPAFILAKGKYNYKSILGETDTYKDTMLKIKSRRQYSLLALLALIPMLRLLIAIYPIGGFLFKLVGFITFALALVMKIFYRKNQVVLQGKKTSDKSKESKTETKTTNTQTANKVENDKAEDNKGKEEVKPQ